MQASVAANAKSMRADKSHLLPVGQGCSMSAPVQPAPQQICI